MQDTSVIVVGVAMGILIGAVMFAFTDYPAWIGLGMIAGAAVGMAWSRRKQP